MNMPDPIRIVNAHGEAMSFNDVFRNVTGNSLCKWLGYGDKFYSHFYESGTIFDNSGSNY